MKFTYFIAFAALTALSQAQETCPEASSADYVRYCEINNLGEVYLRELDADEYSIEYNSGKQLFTPNTMYPVQNGVFYDCACAPKCGVDAVDRYYNPIYKFAQIGLDDSYFSYFHDDTFHYCIAIPQRSLDSELYFQDANGSTIPVFHCPSTQGMNADFSCNGWTKQPVGQGYRHHCYDTYCVDAPWEQVSPYYARHTDEHWTTSYNGVVTSSTTYGQEICHETECEAVTPLTYVAPNLFSISTTIHITTHLGDVRVYSPAVVVAYETEHSTTFGEFEWGFDNSVDVVTQIYFSTRVQAPLFVEIDNYSASNFNGSLDLFQSSAISSLCFNRPNGYLLDGSDELCKQEWLLTLVPEFDDCMIDTVLDLVFQFDCDPKFVQQRGECPFTRGVESNQVSFSFDYASDNWCELLDIEIEAPTAWMASYVDDQCASADDFLVTERAHFEVSVESNEYLTVTGTSLNGLHIVTNCGDGYTNAGWFVTEGDKSYMASDISLEIDNTPSSSCMQRSADKTVRFYFDLDSEFFHPPKKASCEFEVWAVIELEYLGFGENTQLLSVELTNDELPLGSGMPINKGSIKRQGKYAPFEESSASMAAVSAATLVAAAIPALL